MKSYRLELEDGEHRILKLRACEKGLTIKDYILDMCVNAGGDYDEAGE